MSERTEPPQAPDRMEAAVHALTGWLGSTSSILLTLAALAAWALSGPLFASRQAWLETLLVPLTVLTFVLMLLLQRSQNKDTRALQLKLNELIASQEGASNRLIGLESRPEEEARRLHGHYQDLAERARGEADPAAIAVEAAPGAGPAR